MEFKGFVLSLLVLCGVSRLDAYPTGAPPIQCADMMPTGHGVTAQNSLAPYMIITDSEYYMPGQMTMSK